MGRKIRWLIVVLVLIFVTQKESAGADEESKEPMEQEKPYVLSVSEADGEHGWCVTAPHIRLEHCREGFVTKYEVWMPEGEKMEGVLSMGDPIWEPNTETWKEGETRLCVYAETAAGEVLEETKEERKFFLDTTPPEKPELLFQPELVYGETMYGNCEQRIGLSSKEEGSGLGGIYYRIGKGEELCLEEGAEVMLQAPFDGSISAYAKDLAGHQSETVVSKRMVLEIEPPHIEIRIPKGREGLYHTDVTASISVKEENPSSGIRTVRCKVDGKEKVEKQWNPEEETEMTCSVTLSKSGTILVEAEDYAGNQAEKEQSIEIDKIVPKLSVSGVENQEIRGGSVWFSIKATDQSGISKAGGTVTYTDVSGKRKTWELAGREEKGNLTLQQNCEEDGSYQVLARATDRAGNQATEEIHFLIDKKNPIIRHVEQYDGTYRKSFQWKYKPEETIWDFTPYTYTATLDGEAYRREVVCRKEGIHEFKVEVTDAAGNKNEAKAKFVIDRTAPKIIVSEPEEGTVFFWTEQKEDRIERLYVDGEKQDLAKKNGKYQFRLKEPGRHKLQVSASDRAGNETTQIAYVEVEERKEHEQKEEKNRLLSDRKRDVREETDSLSSEEKKEGKERERSPGLFVLLGGGLAASFATIVYFRKRAHKREDAG